jgi:6-pyruvoyltetrahydropterin/6-carboxytetrahydropterin synthase
MTDPIPSTETTPGGRHKIRLRKASHVFSAGHFITLSESFCEPVHGHNWTVAAEIEAAVDPHGMVYDFLKLRELLDEIVATLDHRMLLPTDNPRLAVHRGPGPGGGEEVTLVFENRRWVFPAEECVLLPMVNTTAELLAGWIGRELLARLAAAGLPPPEAIRVEVDECLGQSAEWEQGPSPSLTSRS